MESLEIPSICGKLDEASIKYFEILEELTERKRRLHESLREGFFSLSKARYSMGSRSVGSLQYNATDMKALASVEISEEAGASTFCPQRIEPRKKTFKQRQEGSDKECSNVDVRSNDTQVRQRKVDKKSSEVSELEGRVQELAVEDEKAFRDPLNWFGILVPAALRQGQKSFIDAVDQCVEIATLQNRLMAIQKEYRELRKTKAKLIDEAKESDERENATGDADRTG